MKNKKSVLKILSVRPDYFRVSTGIACNACGFVQAVPTARIFRLVELDMKLIDIRQPGLAQNRLLCVVFFVLRSIL
jgi:hypothetical protein